MINFQQKSNVKIDGFATEFIPDQESGMIIQKGLFTSQDPMFYAYAENICNMFSCSEINKLLIIINDNNDAKIYKEVFPVTSVQRLKKSVKRGEAIFKHDILEIFEISFSDDKIDVNPKDGDQIIWLFRIGFVFGLYFDLTKKMIVQQSKQEMAHLYLKVLYFDLYKVMQKASIQPLIDKGWFPFIQLLGKDHDSLLSIFNENNTRYLPKWCDDTFPNERIKEIVSRWWSNSLFSSRKGPINEGLTCFYEQKYSASISTLVPMVESILNGLSLSSRGKGLKYKGEEITEYIKNHSKIKFSDDSLAFPSLFSEYLNDYFFRHTKSSESEEATRNTVSHGRALDNSFTRENAIKIILILDQIYFYC